MPTAEPQKFNEHRQELFELQHPDIPYFIFSDSLDFYLNRNIPWHWHAMLEFTYVAAGSVEYFWPDGSQVFHTGQALFVNSNVLHQLHALDGQSGCIVRGIQFNHHFLSGGYHSTLEQKYFSPVLQCDAMPVYALPLDRIEGIHMVDALLRILECGENQASGVEFQVQQHLATLWMLLYEQTRSTWKRPQAKNDVSIQRLKQMVTFIHAHYAEPLTLKEIAASANVGERECLRCFQKNLSVTPIAYLNQHRVYMAAQSLLQTTKNVLTVSEESGFSSSSYFTKVFRRIMHCTPKEFQKRGTPPF